jgi:predicted DNA-binding transcriptional regulator AlpA
MEPPRTLETTLSKYFAQLIDAHTERRTKMRTYEFSIIASGLDPEAEDFEQRFYDAGCDDALIAFQKGHIIVDFAREAASITAAIASAVEDVRAAGATVDRVEPDPLVSLAEIAARTHTSRAAISYYSKGQRGQNFPSPVARVTSDSPLWDWSSVAKWLYQHKKLSREEAIEAEAVRAANAAIGNHVPKLEETLERKLEEFEKTLEPA